jgi:hypothetical protein
MATMTISEIDAAIAALEAARSQRLLGGVRVKVAYEGTMVEKSVASLEEINGEIARLQAMRSRLAGGVSGLGPIRPRFGSRP